MEKGDPRRCGAFLPRWGAYLLFARNTGELRCQDEGVDDLRVLNAPRRIDAVILRIVGEEIPIKCLFHDQRRHFLHA